MQTKRTKHKGREAEPVVNTGKKRPKRSREKENGRETNEGKKS
jgi:hypothetical protein